MQRVYPTSLRDVYEFWPVLLDMSSTLPRVSGSCGDLIKGEVVCFNFSHHNTPVPRVFFCQPFTKSLLHVSEYLRWNPEKVHKWLPIFGFKLMHETVIVACRLWIQGLTQHLLQALLFLSLLFCANWIIARSSSAARSSIWARFLTFAAHKQAIVVIFIPSTPTTDWLKNVGSSGFIPMSWVVGLTRAFS